MIYSKSGLDSKPIESPDSAATGSSELSTRLPTRWQKMWHCGCGHLHVGGFCCCKWWRPWSQLLKLFLWYKQQANKQKQPMAAHLWMCLTASVVHVTTCLCTSMHAARCYLGN